MKAIEDKRIKEYRYLEQLKEHMKTAKKMYIPDYDEPFIYPKQLEIHLPGDRQLACNLSCKHCFANRYKKDLGRHESIGLNLLHKLKGIIKIHIYGSSYTEPTASPFLFSYLSTTKMYDNTWGIHTNGTYLKSLEEQNKFLTNIHEISTNKNDYVSISLDAGSGLSWQNLKRKNKSKFWDILQAIEIMAEIREKKQKNSHAIRLTYLVSDDTSSQEEMEFVISLTKMYKINSLRFSIPYDIYNKKFDDIEKYQDEIENPLADKVYNYIKPYLSKNQKEKPFVFWSEPELTAIKNFKFEKCYFTLFQHTLGNDGFSYLCSSVASPTASHLRLGKVTDDLDEFHKQLWMSQNVNFNCKEQCFDKGLRCNRMGAYINNEYRK